MAGGYSGRSTAFSRRLSPSPGPIKGAPPMPLTGAAPLLLIQPHWHRVPPPTPNHRERHCDLPALHQLQKWSRRCPLSLLDFSRRASVHWSAIPVTLWWLRHPTAWLRRQWPSLSKPHSFMAVGSRSKGHDKIGEGVRTGPPWTRRPAQLLRSMSPWTWFIGFPSHK
jgi:hypothetical protein